jgi:hypothetical protein
MRARIRIAEPEDDGETPAASVGSNVTPITARRDSIRARLAADPEPELPTASDPAPF